MEGRDGREEGEEVMGLRMRTTFVEDDKLAERSCGGTYGGIFRGRGRKRHVMAAVVGVREYQPWVLRREVFWPGGGPPTAQQTLHNRRYR